MGIFTDPCINPECDSRVRKGSKFCPKCGTSAPKGLTTCGSCKAEVRTSSKFCWKCGADLAEVAKPSVFGDHWARHPEDFAVRVDDQDIKGWLAKPLLIEHGTRAMLFQGGKHKGELSEGSYDMGGFLKTLNHFMIDQAASVVLTDAGDVTIDLENGGMWTSDRFEVGTVERLVLRIKDPDAMFVNLFKGRNRVVLGDLEEQLAGEVEMLLTGIVAHLPADALFADLDARNQIESQLRYAVATTLSRMGLELVQIRFIRFVGKVFEELRAAKGELAQAESKADITAQRAKLNQRLRETLGQDKMDSFKSQKDFEEFIRQTEHEIGLKGLIRQDEMDRLTQRFQFERDREGLLRRIEIEGIVSEEKREHAWKELIAEEDLRDEKLRRDLDRRVTVATNDAEARKIQLEIRQLEHAQKMREVELEHVQDMAEAVKGQELLERTKKIEQDEADREQQREARTLESRSKATAQALLSIVDGPAAEQIVKMEQLRARANMSPDQMLAMAAEVSPQAAQTLARKYESEGQLSAERVKLLERQILEQRQMADGYADRMERLMQMALSQMGDVAGTRARPMDSRQTVVIPGAGLGQPVVVNPDGGLSGRQCGHCHARLENNGGFCPECGKKS